MNRRAATSWLWLVLGGFGDGRSALWLQMTEAVSKADEIKNEIKKSGGRTEATDARTVLLFLLEVPLPAGEKTLEHIELLKDKEKPKRNWNLHNPNRDRILQVVEEKRLLGKTDEHSTDGKDWAVYESSQWLQKAGAPKRIGGAHGHGLADALTDYAFGFAGVENMIVKVSFTHAPDDNVVSELRRHLENTHPEVRVSHPLSFDVQGMSGSVQDQVELPAEQLPLPPAKFPWDATVGVKDFAAALDGGDQDTSTSADPPQQKKVVFDVDGDTTWTASAGEDERPVLAWFDGQNQKVTVSASIFRKVDGKAQKAQERATLFTKSLQEWANKWIELAGKVTGSSSSSPVPEPESGAPEQHDADVALSGLHQEMDPLADKAIAIGKEWNAATQMKSRGIEKQWALTPFVKRLTALLSKAATKEEKGEGDGDGEAAVEGGGATVEADKNKMFTDALYVMREMEKGKSPPGSPWALGPLTGGTADKIERHLKQILGEKNKEHKELAKTDGDELPGEEGGYKTSKPHPHLEPEAEAEPKVKEETDEKPRIVTILVATDCLDQGTGADQNAQLSNDRVQGGIQLFDGFQNVKPVKIELPSHFETLSIPLRRLYMKAALLEKMLPAEVGAISWQVLETQIGHQEDNNSEKEQQGLSSAPQMTQRPIANGFHVGVMDWAGWAKARLQQYLPDATAAASRITAQTTAAAEAGVSRVAPIVAQTRDWLFSKPNADEAVEDSKPQGGDLGGVDGLTARASSPGEASPSTAGTDGAPAKPSELAALPVDNADSGAVALTAKSPRAQTVHVRARCARSGGFSISR